MQSTDRDGDPRSAVAAASGYWRRRGLPTEDRQVAVAPSAALLLLAILTAARDHEEAPADASQTPPAHGAARDGAATGAREGEATGEGGPPGGGRTPSQRVGVLLPRPSPSWYAAQARLLGHRVLPVPVPAECGGVPDPFAMLEVVRRERRRGFPPRVLVLTIADPITGTAPPPELLHEVCEAAAEAGLLIVSDESWRDTSHAPHDTVLVSPAEMLHDGRREDSVTVLASVTPAHPDAPAEPGTGTRHPARPPVEAPQTPAGPSAGVARFAAVRRGPALARRVREVLGALRAELDASAQAAVVEALDEPESLLVGRAERARARGFGAGALYEAVTAAGGLCRPPRIGNGVYADFEPLRRRLAARGVVDAARLEAELVRRIGPFAQGGHHFGDDPDALRVRLTTGILDARPDPRTLAAEAAPPTVRPASNVPEPSSTAGGGGPSRADAESEEARQRQSGGADEPAGGELAQSAVRGPSREATAQVGRPVETAEGEGGLRPAPALRPDPSGGGEAVNALRSALAGLTADGSRDER